MLPGGNRERCQDVARRDAVGRDVELAPLDGHRAGQGGDAALAGSVDRYPAEHAGAVVGADVDDAAAGSHQGLFDDRLGQEEDAFQVDRHDAVIGLFRNIQQAFALDDAGAVDQDVDPAGLGQNIVDRPLKQPGFAYIKGDRNMIIARQFVGQLLHGSQIQVRQHHAGTGRRQTFRQGAADPAGRAGQQDNFSMKGKQFIQV